MTQLKLTEEKKIGIQGSIQKISFADEAGIIAYSTEDGAIRLVNLADDRMIFEKHDPSYVIYSMKATNDGKLVVCGSYGKLILIYPESGKVSELPAGEGPVMGLSLSRTGLIVCRTIYGTITILDESGVVHRKTDTEIFGMGGVAITKYGSHVIDASGDKVCFIPFKDESAKYFCINPAGGPVNALRVSRDEKSEDQWVFVATMFGGLHIYRLASAEEVAHITGHGGMVSEILVFKEKSTFATTGYSKVMFWKVGEEDDIGTFLSDGYTIISVTATNSMDKLILGCSDSSIRIVRIS